MIMCRTTFYVSLLLCSSVSIVVAEEYNSSPYLSATTVLLNYQKMVQNFKVFIYNYETTKPQFKFATTEESLFYSSLLNSTYLTQHAEEAHMFFVPFSSNTSTCSIARIITRIRNNLPYWNRTLGADHFYLSCAGIPVESNRNLVELKKNAVQISCFPTQRDRLVPHKDLTLPAFRSSHAPLERVGEFCVVEYPKDTWWIGNALRLGCVPVVVAEGLVNDLPFMGVLKWGEMAVFVRNDRVKEGKRVFGDTWRERYEGMRRLGVAASKHFVWNQPPRPFDAFNTIIYQLWLRRHTVRYASMQ